MQPPALSRSPATPVGRFLARLDGAFDRLYGSRWNPLYQTGALTVVLLVVVSVTGIWLLVFYRIGDPYGSVARITDQAWTGRWMRGLHRYASDAALVAVALHAVRMYAQRRSWGRRTLAWVSGLGLVFLLFVCGWTGYVMVWDVHGQLLAIEGARILEALPIFSEPITGAFDGTRPLQGQFFFLNLFLHIVLPIGLGLGLWIHVSRVARPVLAPPRPVWAGVSGALLALALLWPVDMAPPADLLRLPGNVPLDVFYGFWLPISRRLDPWLALAIPAAGLAALALVPLWTRPRTADRPPASVVDPRLCTGCVQCSLDCPWEAIDMVERTDGRADLLARVDPSRCVSCGICAGSCAPMGVGPPGRTGRDQLTAWAERLDRIGGMPSGAVAVIRCERAGGAAIDDAPAWQVACAGSLHTSVVERALQAGAGGVLVLACPSRNCVNREGPRWAAERLFHDREAELHRRVDRRRVRLAHAGPGDEAAARAALASLRAEVAELESDRGPAAESSRECDPAAPREVLRA